MAEGFILGGLWMRRSPPSRDAAGNHNHALPIVIPGPCFARPGMTTDGLCPLHGMGDSCDRRGVKTPHWLDS